MTLIKEDIIRAVATRNSLERKTAKNYVEIILLTIKKSLSIGEEVLISGFGYFKVRHKKARIGRNPKTRVEYEISERTVVTFYPSRVFRGEMNTDLDR
ncbi:MAG: hypothetical protein GY866_26375 [Proteobacteria bacterium]|nr:hypothetical protein [Pseudomonadota bacterium]